MQYILFTMRTTTHYMDIPSLFNGLARADKQTICFIHPSMLVYSTRAFGFEIYIVCQSHSMAKNLLLTNSNLHVH